MDRIIKPLDNASIGGAIQKLINDNIKNINTIFIGEIVDIQNGRVSVIDIVKDREDFQNPIINNLLVCVPYSKEWTLNFKLSKGDKGLCLVSKKDISLYKQNGNACVKNTNRVFDINDSIFIPCSLYDRESNDVDFIIKDKNGGRLIEFKEEELIIKANKIKVTNETNSLKDILNDLIDNIKNLIITTPNGAGSINPASAALLDNIKLKVENLFK